MSTEVKSNKLLDDETIVAIATANGIGSISIIRLSGKEALPLALKLCKKQDLKPRLATLCSLYNSKDEAIDELVIEVINSLFGIVVKQLFIPKEELKDRGLEKYLELFKK